jgi:hypothetical protein
LKDEAPTKSIYKKRLSKESLPILKDATSGRGYIKSSNSFSKWYDKSKSITKYLVTNEEGEVDWQDHFQNFDFRDPSLAFLAPLPPPHFTLHLRASFFVDSLLELSQASFFLGSSDDFLLYLDQILLFDNGGKKYKKINKLVK